MAFKFKSPIITVFPSFQVLRG